MDEFHLQTELTEKSKNEIALFSEKTAVDAEIQTQKRRIKREIVGSVSSLGFYILLVSLFSFFASKPIDWFFFIIFGVVSFIYYSWLYHGIRKHRQTLEELERLLLS